MSRKRAEILSLGAVSYNETTNTSNFEFTIPENANGLVILQFTETQQTPSSPVNSGIKELKVIRPDYDHNTIQLYHDAFLEALTDACFSTIRFMGFTSIPTIPIRSTRSVSSGTNARKKMPLLFIGPATMLIRAFPGSM